jgi:hypothetical protein
MATTAWSDVAASTGCNDGQFCTTGEVCDGAGACGGGGATACGDTLGCTTDTCNEGTNQCDHAIDAGNCVIDAVCYAHLGPNPANLECERCDATSAPTAWSDQPDGTPCTGGTCQVGVCTP